MTIKKQAPILEIFTSIQGEGRFMGKKATFVRTSGCNLKCPWCDTRQSWDPKHEGYGKTVTMLTVDEVLHLISAPLVVVTGGEPCLHYEFFTELVEKGHKQGIIFALETNGTLRTPPGFDHIACSPKPPVYTVHPACDADEFKYVVTEDFDAASIPEEIRSAYAGRIWLQPDGFNMQAMWTKAYHMTQQDPRLRVGVQLHKLMEVR